MTLSAQYPGGSSHRRRLHHCVGFALRIFEKSLPAEASTVRPHIKGLAVALRSLDDAAKSPGVKWPKWRGKTQLLKQAVGSWPVRVQDDHLNACVKENTDDPAEMAVTYTRDVPPAVEGTHAVSTSPVPAVNRSLKINFSDASTALPDEIGAPPGLEISERLKKHRKGRRAKSRMHNSLFFNAKSQAARETEECDGFVNVSTRALAALLEDDDENLIASSEEDDQPVQSGHSKRVDAMRARWEKQDARDKAVPHERYRKGPCDIEADDGADISGFDKLEWDRLKYNIISRITLLIEAGKEDRIAKDTSILTWRASMRVIKAKADTLLAEVAPPKVASDSAPMNAATTAQEADEQEELDQSSMGKEIQNVESTKDAMISQEDTSELLRLVEALDALTSWIDRLLVEKRYEILHPNGTPLHYRGYPDFKYVGESARNIHAKLDTEHSEHFSTRVAKVKRAVWDLALTGETLSECCNEVKGVEKAVLIFKDSQRRLRSERDDLYWTLKPPNKATAPTPASASTGLSQTDLQILLQARMLASKNR